MQERQIRVPSWALPMAGRREAFLAKRQDRDYRVIGTGTEEPAVFWVIAGVMTLLCFLQPVQAASRLSL
jgi:hypothetical protein